jgi:transposase
MVEVPVGKYTYLYESESYRNKEGSPRSRRKLVGKVDPKTGEYKYKQEYIDKMREAGLPVKTVGPNPDKISVTLGDVKKSIIKEYGAYYFLREIAEQIGIRDILATFLPGYWKELLTMAIYLICTEDPFMYCSHWIESTETLSVGDLSSQRISELLHMVTEEEKTNFYMAWTQYRKEREYLALDITSISSWSTLIDDVEWGYNRDKENLPQINVCLLMGEKSRLPVFQTIYSGSLKDVTTLKTTIKQTTCYLSDDDPILLVMDKGFYSKKNVEEMLKKTNNMRFIISVPFTVKFAKEQVASEKKDIDRIENTIISGKNSMRGVTKQRAWYKETLHTHVYYNAMKAAQHKEDLYAHVSTLIKKAKTDPTEQKEQSEFKKYLTIRASSKALSGHTINIKQEVVNNEMETAGWLVLISNQLEECDKAIDIYRSKDVVEKGFLRLKNSIDLGRLRVHSQNNMQNKLFVGFISLILLSHMNKIMLDTEMYKIMTMKEMLMILKKLRVQYIDGHRILFPLTKEQNDILDNFSIQRPV